MLRVCALLILTSLLCNSSAISQGVVKATTAEGRRVLLYPDGTWKYQDTSEIAPTQTKSAYEKPKSAGILISIRKESLSLWLDEAKWKQTGTEGNKTTFAHMSGHVHAMVVTGGQVKSPAGLRQLALETVRNSASDAAVTLEDKRTVNGHEVLCLKIRAVLGKTPYVYYGYYFTGSVGTVQLVSYTSQSLFEMYEGDMTDFLNGLEIYD